jgi:hypothetical protein
LTAHRFFVRNTCQTDRKKGEWATHNVQITHEQHEKREIMKLVDIECTATNLTGNAGLLPLGRFAEKLGVEATLKQTLTLERGANALYQASDVVLLILFGVLAGAQHMNHLALLRNDSVVRRLFDWTAFPVASTLGRIFKLFTPKHCAELSEAEAQLRKNVWGTRWRGRVTFDFDSEVQGVFGTQEGAARGYNPKKKGQRSSPPLLCFVGETRECWHNWFRCGNVFSANGCAEFAKECFARLPKRVWSLWLRADSAFFDGALLKEAESRGARYTIKVSMRGLSTRLASQRWRKQPNRPNWEVTEFQHACRDWQRPRRFVAVRHRTETLNTAGLFPVLEVTYEYFCYVTNLTWSPWGIHRYYGQRATSENWIAWCKSQMAAGRILTQDFWANSAVFQTCILAYNLLVWMLWLTMKRALWEEPATIRAWLVHVPARYVERSRRCLLKLADDWWAKERWTDLSQAVTELQFA